MFFGFWVARTDVGGNVCWKVFLVIKTFWTKKCSKSVQTFCWKVLVYNETGYKKATLKIYQIQQLSHHLLQVSDCAIKKHLNHGMYQSPAPRVGLTTQAVPTKVSGGDLIICKTQPPCINFDVSSPAPVYSDTSSSTHSATKSIPRTSLLLA